MTERTDPRPRTTGRSPEEGTTPETDGDGATTTGGDGSTPTGTEGSTRANRRRVLQGTATLAATGLAGCAGILGGGCGAITVEGPDGETNCVAPVESDHPIEEYYGYDTENHVSSATPDGLEVEDATVTFVHRNSATGDRHLVVVHDPPGGDTGGAAPMTFRGVSGYEWAVLDDDPGNDGYATLDGTFGETESVAWQWGGGRTDGGAFGPLGESFDVELVHLAEATVNGVGVSRSKVDRWLVVDGDDLENPVELATFEDGDGDVSVKLSD